MANTYSKDEFYYDLKKLHSEHGIVNKKIFDRYSGKSINFNYQCLKYGGLKNICIELNIENRHGLATPKDEILRRIKLAIDNECEIGKETLIKYGVNSSAVKRIFGNYTNLYKEVGYNKEFHRNVSDEEIINDIKKFILDNGINTSLLYRKNGKYSSTLVRRVGGWNSIVESLGYSAFHNFGLDNIKEELISLYEEYGFISRNLINDNCSFTYNAVIYYLKNNDEIESYIGIEKAFKSQNRTSGEASIKTILDELIGEENYIEQFSSEWLLNVTEKRMYADFYIPSKDIVIEYDGKQHYEFIPFFHKTIENFNKSVERDKLKEKLLLDRGIKTIRIPYNVSITKEYIKEIVK